MKTLRLFALMSVITSGLGMTAGPAWAKDGVLSKVQSAQTNYCHLHFPAIREDTLLWDAPVLKDASTRDIIHLYGPCDYDPHGKEAVAAQKRDLRDWQRLNDE